MQIIELALRELKRQFNRMLDVCFAETYLTANMYGTRSSMLA